LAGVENVFNCEDKDVINRFDDKYAQESDKYKINPDDKINPNDKRIGLKHINFNEEYIERQSKDSTKGLVKKIKVIKR
jgi:hypothetical protein